jgi:hypothetical protein
MQKEEKPKKTQMVASKSIYWQKYTKYTLHILAEIYQFGLRAV